MPCKMSSECQKDTPPQITRCQGVGVWDLIDFHLNDRGELFGGTLTLGWQKRAKRAPARCHVTGVTDMT